MEHSDTACGRFFHAASRRHVNFQFQQPWHSSRRYFIFCLPVGLNGCIPASRCFGSSSRSSIELLFQWRPWHTLPPYPIASSNSYSGSHGKLPRSSSRFSSSYKRRLSLNRFPVFPKNPENIFLSFLNDHPRIPQTSWNYFLWKWVFVQSFHFWDFWKTKKSF